MQIIGFHRVVLLSELITFGSVRRGEINIMIRMDIANQIFEIVIIDQLSVVLKIAILQI